jgi:hypothetical protein
MDIGETSCAIRNSVVSESCDSRSHSEGISSLTPIPVRSAKPFAYSRRAEAKPASLAEVTLEFRTQVVGCPRSQPHWEWASAACPNGGDSFEAAWRSLLIEMVRPYGLSFPLRRTRAYRERIIDGPPWP